jgi:hypothetical protein
MTKVENRIACARYFLRMLVEKNPPYPEFDWLLEAFFTAARSVGWLMRAEAPDKAIYAEWDRSIPLSPEVKELFTLVTDTRNRVQKSGPITSKFALSMQLDESEDLLLMMGENAGLKDGERFERTGDISIDMQTNRVEIRHPDGKVVTGSLVYTFNMIDEFPHEDVLDKCERYMRHLEVGYADWQTYCAARLRGAPAPSGS